MTNPSISLGVQTSSGKSSSNAPVALVTGSGAPRVGNTIARALAAAGYHLMIHANTSRDQAEATAAELRARGNEALAVCADLRVEQAVHELVATTRAHFGRLDVLVNAAAIWQRKPLELVSAADVRLHFESNTLATFLCCRAAGLIMVQQESGGAIVNIGDWATVRPYLDYSAYFASKGTIPTMTRDLAVELAARNPRVRVNAVLPGPVMLPADLSAAERASAIAGTLVKREGTPEHVADAVLFLIRNDFVTGVCLPVDGGRSISGV